MMLMMITNYDTGCRQIDEYASAVRSGSVKTNQWIKAGVNLVLAAVRDEAVTIDQARIDKAIELGERYFYELFPWQKFVIGAAHIMRSDFDAPFFSRLDMVMGRGAGKNGFVSFLMWWFTTPYYGVKGYDVELIANSEKQAITSFEDVYVMLSENGDRMGRQFDWTKTLIRNTLTNSKIRYHTSNAKTKDSLRSGCIIFDEFHGYENYDMISVFQSGLGKKRHSREIWIGSNGHTRGAVFDKELASGKEILTGQDTKAGRLPLYWMLEDADEAESEDNWVMSVPSLPYMPFLRDEMQKHWALAQRDNTSKQEFMTKRMCLPMQDPDIAVTSWDNIVRASEPLPDLTGRECVFGIDYAKLADFASAGLLFRDGDQWYWIKKTWVCRSSPDLHRIKAPLEEWAREGHLEWVDDVEISPKRVAAWISEMRERYRIIGGAIDSYRYTLMREALEDVGIDTRDKATFRLTSGSAIMKTAPLITSWFANGQIHYGDDPEMRWAVNNTKLVASRRDTELGNYTYGKIEGKSRKNDSFQALVQGAALADLLSDAQPLPVDIPVFTW